MDKKFWVGIFSELGERLGTFGYDARSREAICDAIAANGWFTEHSIILSVNAIREQMLRRKALTEWLESYGTLPSGHGKTLGIIMAGNIPLVGFHDLMCGLVCGYECVVKTSSKDSYLITYITEILRDICNDIKVRFTFDFTPDVLIATGSDNTIRHLRHLYPESTALFRGSRSSIAVLSGAETEDELQSLADDIFTYSGLGCRNASLLFLPEGYDPEALMPILGNYPHVHEKYRNNYRQSKALAVMSGKHFLDGGFFTLHESPNFPLNISELAYSYYSSLQEVEQWIARHDSQLQCIVSSSCAHPSAVAFGRAQFPGPRDYPDRTDTIDFLSNASH